ncbi:MAG TPA: HAD family hydrolase [Nitriliruptorales bacterium]|nr:HAD family hydrolase [Nitriliruptorales bacterium]
MSAPHHRRRAAAFFDLDRTLISGASTFTFGIAAWRNDMIPTRELLSDAVNALIFRLTGGSEERVESTRERILHAVAGQQVEDFLALNDEIVPRLLSKLRPESRSLLEMHAEADRDRFIVSATPRELVEPLARALDVEGAIGTESEIVDGCYTGELDGPFAYGQGKAEAIEKLAAERGYDLRLSYAYSDSSSDLPMLELVGHPVAVNPDRTLETVAHQRGWPIVVFSRKAKRVVKTTTAATSAAGLAVATYLLGRRHGRISTEAQQGRLSALVG